MLSGLKPLLRCTQPADRAFCKSGFNRDERSMGSLRPWQSCRGL